MTPPPATSIRLLRGQAHSFHVEAGSVCLVEHGSVMLTTEPRWLAGMVWRSQLRIPEGEVHVFDAGGWVTLCADSGTAELWCMPAQPSRAAPRPFTSALRSFARRTFA